MIIKETKKQINKSDFCMYKFFEFYTADEKYQIAIWYHTVLILVVEFSMA